ncbi:MAG: hypothetical protein IPO22_18160 [Anaerolineales bacterium]|nr:hypothetical protein [Anaerolineales bacterium]
MQTAPVPGKLVARVERAEDGEPLPDIDFNIRAGNTLVGFATYADVERSVNMGMTGGKERFAIRQTLCHARRGYTTKTD